MRDPICIEAPSSASAVALVSDLAWLGSTDLVPLDAERWEVRVVDDGSQTGRVLTVVEQWVLVWNLGSTIVRIAGKTHTLCASDPRPVE